MISLAIAVFLGLSCNLKGTEKKINSRFRYVLALIYSIVVRGGGGHWGIFSVRKCGN